MPAKPEVQSFTQAWNKTVGWAKKNNIPYSSYYPVYQLEAQKLLTTGTQYSEAERINAIQAANGLTPGTALPTDKANPADILNNAKTNAADIFTGMNPIHLFSSMMDTVSNTIHHPSSIYNAVEDVGKILNPLDNHQQTVNAIHDFAKTVLSQNDILQFVPGFVDVAEAESPGGFKTLADHPLSSLLDVIPVGRVASEALGRTAIGDAAATRIGISNPELRKLGVWRVGSRVVKSKTLSDATVSKLAKLPGGTNLHPWLVHDGTGATIGLKEMPTIQDLITEWRNKVQIGSEQGQISKERLIANQMGTRLVMKLVQPALRMISKLSPEQRTALTQLSLNDFRPLSEVMADASIDQKVRDAFEAASNWGHTMKQLQIQAGNVIAVKTTIKDAQGKEVTQTEYYSAEEGSSGQELQMLLNASKDAQDNLDKAMKPVTILLYQMEETDRNMAGAFTVVDQMRAAISDVLKRSIPDEAHRAYVQSPGVADVLRATLPDAERWDRAVANPQFGTQIRNLLGLNDRNLAFKDQKLTLNHAKAVRDLFIQGGLLDQMIQAYKDQDWVKMNKFAHMAKRKFDGAAFAHVQGKSQLAIVRHIVNDLQQYAAKRQKVSEEVNKRMVGYYRGAKMSKAAQANSVMALAVKADKAHQRFVAAGIKHPPDVWNNVFLTMLTNKYADSEHYATLADGVSGHLKASNPDKWTDTELEKLRSDPRNLMEIATSISRASLENGMLVHIDHGEFLKTVQSIYDEISSLRARGEKPLYIPALTTKEAEGKLSYNVYIRGLTPNRVGASYEKVWGYKPTIFDVGAGMLKGTKDLVEHDMRQQFIDQSLKPRLMEAEDVKAQVRNYYSAEITGLGDAMRAGEPVTETESSIIQRGLDKMGLIEYKPNSLFGEGFSYASLGGDYYIHKDIASAFKKTIDTFQMPAQSIYDRGTQFFRFSILGLSPRYTAHIMFGGAYLVALRGNLGMFRYIPAAAYVALHGEFSENMVKQFPYAPESIIDQATEEGLASAQYHFVAMRSAVSHWMIPAWLDRHVLEDTQSNRIRAMAELNIQFTRAIVRAQRALVYLDGAKRALNTGSFYGEEYVPREEASKDALGNPLDSQGRRVFTASGRQIHDTVRHETPMTPEQAHKEGMDAVVHVMGDLRAMTPLERSLLAKVFPFYGWTRHILQYVMSYPFDHPYRALIVSQIAEQNTIDTASGLPQRIQLLTMLGMPDEFGNVTAIDTKALDPLRDTANYASLTGFFEALNPALTALPAMVDPQFKFGGQNLYPQVTYNNLYGVKTAGAGGNLWTAAEQFVPQLGGIDAAFNISGQYAYLKQSNPSAFSKKIFESFGLPFMPTQINLRQTAAKAEISKYQIAKADATTALDSGDFSTVDQYPSTLPDPMQPLYDVTPAYLKALYDYSKKRYGLPPTAALAPPPAPPL